MARWQVLNFCVALVTRQQSYLNTWTVLKDRTLSIAESGSSLKCLIQPAYHGHLASGEWHHLEPQNHADTGGNISRCLIVTSATSGSYINLEGTVCPQNLAKTWASQGLCPQWSFPLEGSETTKSQPPPKQNWIERYHLLWEVGRESASGWGGLGGGIWNRLWWPFKKYITAPESTCAMPPELQSCLTNVQGPCSRGPCPSNWREDGATGRVFSPPPSSAPSSLSPKAAPCGLFSHYPIQINSLLWQDYVFSLLETQPSTVVKVPGVWSYSARLWKFLHLSASVSKSEQERFGKRGWGIPSAARRLTD